MRTTRSLLLIALLLALALFAAGCGDDGDDGDAKDTKSSGSESGSDSDGGGGDDDSDEPADEPADVPTNDADETFRIQVNDGQVIGGPQSMKAKAGDDVRIEILSDSEDEVHVHGIDEEADVPKGTPAVLEFTVEDPGSYEVEFHDLGLVLGAVVVS